MQSIKVDGSKEGFLEYICLYLLGDQFYLYWHANYDDTVIVTDRASLRELIMSLEKLYPLPKTIKQQAEWLDLAPRVIPGVKDTLVSVVLFSKWKGFTRREFKVGNSFPHTISESEEVLIEYSCRTTF